MRGWSFLKGTLPFTHQNCTVWFKKKISSQYPLDIARSTKSHLEVTPLKTTYNMLLQTFWLRRCHCWKCQRMVPKPANPVNTDTLGKKTCTSWKRRFFVHIINKKHWVTETLSVAIHEKQIKLPKNPRFRFVCSFHSFYLKRSNRMPFFKNTPFQEKAKNAINCKITHLWRILFYL